MKEFWLGILKNVITYVLMIIIIIVGGISITTQKFPPSWKEIQSAVQTVKTAYMSMLSLRQSLPQMAQGLQMPNTDQIVGQVDSGKPGNVAGNALTDALEKSGSADHETKTALALISSMQQQMGQQQAPTPAPPAVLSPELKLYLQVIEKQNSDMIARMDKIQVYLAGLHQYMAQVQQRAPATTAPQATAQPVAQPIARPSQQQVVQPTTPARSAPAQQPASLRQPATAQNTKK